MTLQLRVLDGFGNLGEDRRTVAIHSDSTLRHAPIHLPGSGESSPALADVNRDGVLDIVQAGGDGSVHVLDGATGAELPGFPAHTDPLPIHASPAYASGEVPLPHESVIGAAAADDLDGDGRVEIVVASIRGRLYVFDDHGQLRAGFPVATDPNLSLPANRNPLNDMLRGFAGAPVLANLDAAGQHPALEILASALDGNLYAWRADGAPVAGFPVRLADRAKVAIDPATGKATPLAGVDARERAAKSLSSPAVGDLDGDGRPEIVVATNEEYGNELNGFAIESKLFKTLAGLLGQADIDDFSVDTQGRVYAVKPDGNGAAGGPFLAGWPVKVPLLTPGVLPTVGTGTPGAPAITDIDGAGSVRVAIFGAIGPVMLLQPNGTPSLGSINGAPRALAIDFPLPGFPTVPATAGSPDAPFFGALGAGAFGDITGDGLPEYVAPTGGVRKLLRRALRPGGEGRSPERRLPSSWTAPLARADQLTAWNPRTGAVGPRVPARGGRHAVHRRSGARGRGRRWRGQRRSAEAARIWCAPAVRNGSQPAGWPRSAHGWRLSIRDRRVMWTATARSRSWPPARRGDACSSGTRPEWPAEAGASLGGLRRHDRRNTENGDVGCVEPGGRRRSARAASAGRWSRSGPSSARRWPRWRRPLRRCSRGRPAPVPDPEERSPTSGRATRSRRRPRSRESSGGCGCRRTRSAALAPLHERLRRRRVRATLEREIACDPVRGDGRRLQAEARQGEVLLVAGRTT